ncbi:MAG TPA: TIM barrel protein [Bryobacteraceae bacterium]|nr:TIM barrel protein [Bryobacteraceae bacterium]
MTTSPNPFTRLVAVSLLAASCLAQGLSGDFFAFDNGTGRDQKLPFEEQAALLKRAGYAGMGIYSGTARIPELLQALDAQKLRLLSIYVHCYVDGRAPAIDPDIPEAIRQLAGRETMLMLTVQGNGPGAEERAIANVREVADLAAESGLRVCLYPHWGFYVETTPDALRIARKTGRANVGVALNLFHTVLFHLNRCGEGYLDLAPLIRQSLPRLLMLSINGIRFESGAPVITTLDDGDYEVAPFIRELGRAGYRGPVALQSYLVKGDLQENLARSLRAWKRFRTR